MIAESTNYVKERLRCSKENQLQLVFESGDGEREGVPRSMDG